MKGSTEKTIHAEKIRLANEAVAAKAGAAKTEEYRLHYHFMPAAGWMNDPNGLIQYKGEYHLFFQHHPYSDKNGPMYWGHAKSKDLVHWEHLPIALAPTEPYEFGEKGGYGCWSGSAVDHDGVLTLIYTGHVDGKNPEEVQCAATSTDGIVFEKLPAPVIPGTPDAANVGFRDPKVWQHEGQWYLVLGSGQAGKGKALLYRSGDLENWEYMGVAAESDGNQGDMWECPDLFPLNGKHVLVLSPMNMKQTKNLYMVGEMDYESGKFTPELADKLDCGPDFYAAQTFRDDRGRRIVIGWMDRWGSKMSAEDRGWYGAMTLPRELKLQPDGTVAFVPVAELEALRTDGRAYPGQTLEDGAAAAWRLPDGKGFEWIGEFDFPEGKAGELEITLLRSEELGEETVLRYSPERRTLVLDTRKSGAGDVEVSVAEIPESAGGYLKLQVFVDRTSIEVFANDGQRVITSRVYPALLTGELQMKASGGTVSLKSLDTWSLRSIWD